MPSRQNNVVLVIASALAAAMATSIVMKLTDRTPGPERAEGRFDPVKWPVTVSIGTSVENLLKSRLAPIPAAGVRPIVIRKAEDAIRA